MDAPMKRYIAVILDLLGRPVQAANAAGNELVPRIIDLALKPKPNGSPSTTVSRPRWRRTARSNASET